jgi:uncharacterized phage protein (TIGR01671 family)
MRELKFRAWDGKMYLDHSSLCCPSFSLGEILNGDYVIEQYTGLHDKNGKEIYEGDIVKIESKSYGVFSVPIKWLNGRSKFGGATWDGAQQISMPDCEWDLPHKPCKCGGAMFKAMSIMDMLDVWTNKNKNIEIIGNIHENPELLEEKE